MTHLILAGSSIVAVADEIEPDADGITTPDGRYPFAAGVTGAEFVDALPGDFALGRYEFEAGEFRRLPEPPRALTADDLDETDETWS